MVLKVFKQEIALAVPARRMFKASVGDCCKLIPQLVPAIVASCELLFGDGRVGSITRANLTDKLPFRCVIDRIDAYDEEQLVYKYTILAGGFVGTKYDAAGYEVRFEPTGDGECACTIIGQCNTYHETSFTEEDIEMGKKCQFGLYKAVEAYLQVNPHEYN